MRAMHETRGGAGGGGERVEQTAALVAACDSRVVVWGAQSEALPLEVLVILNAVSPSLSIIASSPPQYFLTSHCTLPPRCSFVAHFPMSIFFVRTSTPFICPPPLPLSVYFFPPIRSMSPHFQILFFVCAPAHSSLVPSLPPLFRTLPPGTRAKMSPPCKPNTTPCRARSRQALGAGFFRLSKRAEVRGAEGKKTAVHSARARGSGRGRAGRAGRRCRLVARGAQTRG